jgi:hypothetical protein
MFVGIMGKNIRQFETHVFGNSKANGCYNILSGEYVGTIIFVACCFIFI